MNSETQTQILKAESSIQSKQSLQKVVADVRGTDLTKIPEINLISLSSLKTSLGMGFKG